jgi:YD repeat-containing protein
MCTVSVICVQEGQDAGVWLVSSRDELHERMPSLPPRVHHLGKRQAIFPVDPEGGGTWVGANDLGTAVSLLNHYPEYVPEATMKQSRGDLVVRLLAADDVSKALATLAYEDLTAYGSCKLVTVNAAAMLMTLTWDGQHAKLEHHDLPQVWASSSTHHAAANDHRRTLFDAQKPTMFAGLCAFHSDQSHLDGALNVLMHSPEARTVSLTAVHIAFERVTLHHLPLTATQPDAAKQELEQATFQPYQLQARAIT